MKPRRGLKRLIFGLVSIAAVVGIALAVMPWLMRGETVRQAVQNEIRFATGLEPELRGDVSIALFPSGSAAFSDIVLRAGAGEESPLTAERLVAQLRFVPLLLGRVELGEITLIRPQILVTLDRGGHSNWGGMLGRLARSGSPAKSGPSFSAVRLVEGRIAVRDEASGATEQLAGADLSLAWPAISKSFGATGQFVWRGERMDASLTVGDFLAALNGERSGAKLRLSGAPFKLGFDGHVSRKPTLKLEGTVAADTGSLRSAFQWAGKEPLPGGFGRFAVKAQANVVGGTIALTNVNLDLDGNAAEGVLSVTLGERPQLQGTLAAESIDLSPYLPAIRAHEATDREWSRIPFRLDGLNGIEFDLRLSAGRVALGASQIGRTALAANLRDGRFTLTIGESQAFGGVLKGAVGLARIEHGADVSAQLQFADVDLQTCISALFGVRRIEGRGSVALTVAGAGSDVLSLTRTLSGMGSLTAQRGAVTGVNVEQVLRRLERRPLSGAGDFRNGRTPFDTLAVNLKITDGTATVEDVKLEGSAVRLAMGGSASIPARDLDLKGTASLAAAPKEPAGGFELPFIVRGPWDDPVMLPDAQSLIRRSGAAAPLLDAVRGGRARDAVRSAIEQLTRGGEPQNLPARPPTAAANP